MISDELQKKLDWYEQIYYSLDMPIPFKGELLLHPVKVSDYFKFHGCLHCLTMDKTIKEITDENGMIIKVADVEGISKSYLAYLIDKMKDEKNGAQITSEVLTLLELVFQIPRGLYCANCHKQISYEESFKGLNEYIESQKEKAQKLFEDSIAAQKEKDDINNVPEEERDYPESIPNNLLDQIVRHAQIEYYQKMLVCPDCGEPLRDIYSIKSDNGQESLIIKDEEINAREFDELKAIIPRQNILDYDGDKYIDPELKEELELKAQMQNKDYTQPTLEKQLICVSVGTGYSFEYLYGITMRKLSLLLRMIDKKETYYAQLQASMSGMVKFPEGSIKHWIFTDDKKNIKDEITSLDMFEDKFKMVT